MAWGGGLRPPWFINMQALVWFRSTTLEPAAERKCKVREMAWSAQQHPENAATVLDPGVFYR
jgi:hypothetical protein